MSADRLSRALTRSPRLFERLCAPEERWEWTAPEGAGLAWACALWCAKEAAVKAERAPADLLGRSLRIESVGPAAPGGEQVVVVRSHLGNAFEVRTAVVGGHVRAWTE